MSLKIIFAGTSEFAVPSLEALIAYQHTVLAVYTPPDRLAGRGLKLTPSPIKTAAIQHHIPIYQPATLRDAQTQQTLNHLNADLIVVAAYGLLLPKQVLEMPRYGCINIHPSLLPRWRGAAPIPRSIEAGDIETGITIMQLDEGLDTGDIWLQVTYPIDSTDTSQSLYDKLAPMSAELLLKAIAMMEAGNHRPIPQNNAQATYANKIDKAEGNLDWQQSAIILERKIRAFNPWPIAYTTWKDKILRIWVAKTVSEINGNNRLLSKLAVDSKMQGALAGKTGAYMNVCEDLSTAATQQFGATVASGKKFKPGEVVNCDNTGIDVMTGDGVLRLLKIQLPGGKCLDVSDFVRGHGKELGSFCRVD